MGTIAARDCLRVLELGEHVAAILLLACCQGVDLRNSEEVSLRTRKLHEAVRKLIPMVEDDRRQDLDIQQVVALHRAGSMPEIGRGKAFSRLTTAPPAEPPRPEPAR